MARLVDLSERGAVEPMGEQGLLAEDVHAGSRGRQAARRQQEACRAGSSGSVPSATSRTGAGAVARVATIWAAHRWPRPRWAASCWNAYPEQVGTARSMSLSMIRASSAVQARNQAEKRSSSRAHASVLLIAEQHSTAESRKCTLPTGWLQHR